MFTRGMATTRVVHFEINADDPECVVKFFQTVFGWKIEKWKGATPYWLVMTGDPKRPGIDGGIQKRIRAGTAVVNTMHVADVDEIAKRVERNGGKIASPRPRYSGSDSSSTSRTPRAICTGRSSRCRCSRCSGLAKSISGTIRS